jgi:hypothetical protein
MTTHSISIDVVLEVAYPGLSLKRGDTSSDGIRSVKRGIAVTSATSGRWSEAILATGLSWARMD